MNKKIICKKCGTENREGSKYCKKCGISLVETTKKKQTLKSKILHISIRAIRLFFASIFILGGLAGILAGKIVGIFWMLMGLIWIHPFVRKINRMMNWNLTRKKKIVITLALFFLILIWPYSERNDTVTVTTSTTTTTTTTLEVNEVKSMNTNKGFEYYVSMAINLHDSSYCEELETKSDIFKCYNEVIKGIIMPKCSTKSYYCPVSNYNYECSRTLSCKCLECYFRELNFDKNLLDDEFCYIYSNDDEKLEKDCLSSIAVYQGNLSKCSKIDDEEFKRNCYLQTAYRNEITLNECDPLETEYYDICYEGVAYRLRNISICEKLPSENKRRECISNIATRYYKVTNKFSDKRRFGSGHGYSIYLIGNESVIVDSAPRDIEAWDVEYGCDMFGRCFCYDPSSKDYYTWLCIWDRYRRSGYNNSDVSVCDEIATYPKPWSERVKGYVDKCYYDVAIRDLNITLCLNAGKFKEECYNRVVHTLNAKGIDIGMDILNNAFSNLVASWSFDKDIMKL